jgi:predicted metal-dependent RNase
VEGWKSLKVAAKVSAKLKNSHAGIIIWSEDVYREPTVDRREVNDVARKMSNALQASVDELLGRVEKKISESNEAKP